jgi:hypothetical protein
MLSFIGSRAGPDSFLVLNNEVLQLRCFQLAVFRKEIADSCGWPVRVKDLSFDVSCEREMLIQTI